QTCALPIYSITIPAEDGAACVKENLVAHNGHLPHIGKVATGLGNLVTDGHELHHAEAVLLEIAEIADGAGPDPPIRPFDQGSDDGPIRNFDQPPGRPVKFENAAVIAEIHDATIILSDRPVLEAGVVVGRRVVGDEGAADFVRSCLLCECGLPEKGQQKEQETGNRPCSTKTT